MNAGVVWRTLFANGTTRVHCDGRKVAYRSLDEIVRALMARYAAENTATRPPYSTPGPFIARDRRVIGRLRDAWRGDAPCLSRRPRTPPHLHSRFWTPRAKT